MRLARRWPDFFIVGAPKCGTTALASYLRAHPEVFMPALKEPHFFGSDLVFSWPRMTEAEYLELFADAGDAERAGEASVWYLRSSRAAVEIQAVVPDARVIVMLRNPVDMMYSLHAQRVFNGDEDLDDFGAALAAEPARRAAARIPRWGKNLMGYLYREAACFADQVRRYLDVFGRDRVHPIIFDDFRGHTAEVYTGTCRFLGVSDQFRPRFDVVNPAKRARSRTLQRWLRDPSPRVAALWRLLGLERTRTGGYKGWLRRLNTRDVTQPAMNADLRRRLQREFLSEVEELSRLLGRDLTPWCREPTAAPARPCHAAGLPGLPPPGPGARTTQRRRASR